MGVKESDIGKTLFNMGMVALMLVIFLGGITVFRPSREAETEKVPAQELQGDLVGLARSFEEKPREAGSNNIGTPMDDIRSTLKIGRAHV